MMTDGDGGNLERTGGATLVRTTQLGFAGELTSAWGAETGYSWKRYALVGVALTNPTLQLTGDKAVTPDGNTSLTAGTKGWFEPDANRNGYIFITPSSGGSPAPPSSWKQPVRAATVVAGTLSTSFANGQTVDGVTLATGDRVLIKNQSSAAANGIYTVNSSGAPTRATDADSASDLLGATIAATEGTVNADTVWVCTANATITVGGTALPWKRVSGNVDSSSPTSTDNAVARWDGTAGNVIQDSAVTISDTGDVSAASLDLGGQAVIGTYATVGGVIHLNNAINSQTIYIAPPTAPLGGYDFTYRSTQAATSFTAASERDDGVNPVDYSYISVGLVSLGFAGLQRPTIQAGFGLGGDPNNDLAVYANRIVINRWDGSGEKNGVTGTLGAGAVATGGIVTDLGSGTVATTADITSAIGALSSVYVAIAGIGATVQAWSSTLDEVAAGTWVGTTSITTLGTVTTGAWNGTAIDLAYGGTGATDAAGARANLGLAIGSDVQAYSPALDAVSGTNTGDQDLSGYVPTSAIGSTVQAYSSVLDALAAVATRYTGTFVVDGVSLTFVDGLLSSVA